jgi:hypothetical protein
VPTLNVAGWWDQEDFYGPLKIYETLEKVDKESRSVLVVGPWNHGGCAFSDGERLGRIEFGSATARYFREQIQAPFFAYYLKDRGKLSFEPPIRDTDAEADRTEMGMRGVYREIVRPDRLVSTEVFDDPWYEGKAVDTLVLVERGGQTTATTTVLYASPEVRDAVLKTPMARGVAESYDKLDELLASA